MGFACEWCTTIVCRKKCVSAYCTQGGISTDPNEKSGPTGYGEERFIDGRAPLTYRARFENLESATAPAAEVRISDTLGPGLDLNSFRIREFHFGSTTVAVPDGRSAYQTIVDLTPEIGLLVALHASVDSTTRQATFLFRALDPETMQLPADATRGFLPPNDETGRGEGYVEYTVAPRSDAATGAVIRNQASIVFDYNDAIATNEVFNTIDAGAPTSQVLPLPAESVTPFWVELEGADDPGGCGIAQYRVFVSTDGGAFVLWTSTANTAVEYPGEIAHTYAFYSVAVDYVGNTEVATPGAQATTTVTGAARRLDLNLDGNVDFADFELLAACLNGPGVPSIAPRCPRADLNDDKAVDLLDLAVFQAAFPNGGPAGLRGDMNCDGAVNGQDIDGFVLVLLGLPPYTEYYSWNGIVNRPCDHLNGDMNGDGAVNGQDIDAFVAALLGG